MIELAIVGAVVAALVFASRRVTLGSGADSGADVAPVSPDDFVGPIQENADVPNRSTSDANISQGVSDFADAIAHAEGFGIAGAIPTRANNPGDLVMPNWRGERLGAEGISVFGTADQGWAALYHQVQLIENGRSHVYDLSMTIGEMADKYTRTQQPDWARNVATWLSEHGYPGTTASTALSEIFNA